MLKADAVPTVFKRTKASDDRATIGKQIVCEGLDGSSSTDLDGSQSRKVRRGAYEK